MRTAAGSRIMRNSNSARTPRSEIGATWATSPGVNLTRPSRDRRRMASRTGVREAPSRSAMATSLSRAPGPSSQDSI